MGNTAPRLPEPKLVKYKPQYHPGVKCKFCTTEFINGEIICYSARQYWHHSCPTQDRGEHGTEQ